MKKFLSLSSLATLAIVLGMVSWGSSLNAQNTPSTSPNATPPSQQTPSTQQPPSPEMPPANQQTPRSQTQTPSQSQTPDTTAPESGSRAGSQPNSDAAPSGQTAGASQTFTGTVVKQGDKYVLKDDTGKTYDIDHQTDVAKFEGKRVRVQGTLDPSGKIMVK